MGVVPVLTWLLLWVLGVNDFTEAATTTQVLIFAGVWQVGNVLWWVFPTRMVERWHAQRVWQRLYGTNLILQGAARPAGGGWQTPADLSAAGQNPAPPHFAGSRPSVAADAQGNAVAIWLRFDGANFIVQGAVRPAGGGWQAPVDLSAAGQDAALPQVAVDAQGNAVTVWQRFDGAKLIVQGAVRAGGEWQVPVDVSAADQNAFDPQVAVDAQGNAVAVWSNGTHSRVQSAVRPAGGDWQAPVDLSAAGEDAAFPQLAVDPQGNAVAIWLAPSTWGSHHGRRVDPQGNAVASWLRFKGADSNLIVQGAVRPAGGGWQAPVDLSAAGQHLLAGSRPSVAVDAQGNAVAIWVWQRAKFAKFIVQGAVRSAGGGWRPPTSPPPASRRPTRRSLSMRRATQSRSGGASAAPSSPCRARCARRAGAGSRPPTSPR